VFGTVGRQDFVGPISSSKSAVSNWSSTRRKAFLPENLDALPRLEAEPGGARDQRAD